MLKDDFYHITEQHTADSPADGTREKHIFRVVLNRDHRVYEGHFPGNPVVPGVCQVGMIGELIAVILQRKVQLESAGNIKFLSMIQPTVNSRLQIEIEILGKEAETHEVQAVISAEKEVFLKFRGRFTTLPGS